MQYIGANIIGDIFVKMLKTTFCIYCIEVGWLKISLHILYIFILLFPIGYGKILKYKLLHFQQKLQNVKYYW